MSTDGFVQIDPDNVGKKIDNAVITRGTDTIYRQRVEVHPAANISTDNSTTALLASAATYTGTWEQTPDSHVLVSCKSNVAGTLYLDFSQDGSTPHSTFPVSGFAVWSNINEIHTAVKGNRYFRVRYINGASTQASFFLQTEYFNHAITLNAPINQSIGLNADATITRPTEFHDEVRLGRRSGVTGWNKFAYREGLTAAGGEESIWAATGNFTILTSASTFTITYNAATDGAGQTGATQLYFYYIDSDGNPAISPHTLGATGSDVTSFSGFGINRCVVSANGGAIYNTNAITITATTGGSKQAIIPALISVTQQAIFFNGANHVAIAKFLRTSIDVATKTAIVEIKGYVYNRQFNTRYEVYREKIDTSVTLNAQLIDPTGFVLNATDVLYFVADSSANGVDVHCRFSLTMYQNS